MLLANKKMKHEERMLAFCGRIYQIADIVLMEQKKLVTV